MVPVQGPLQFRRTPKKMVLQESSGFLERQVQERIVAAPRKCGFFTAESAENAE